MSTFYSPAKPTKGVTTRRAVTYSDADGGAFVTEVVGSKKHGHEVLARRCKRNKTNAAPGRLSDISISSKTLLSPTPGKTHRPVAHSDTKSLPSGPKKKATVSDSDVDDLCASFSTKARVKDDGATENTRAAASPMPKEGRYTTLIKTTADGPFSPVTRSTRNA